MLLRGGAASEALGDALAACGGALSPRARAKERFYFSPCSTLESVGEDCVVELDSVSEVDGEVEEVTEVPKVVKVVKKVEDNVVDKQGSVDVVLRSEAAVKSKRILTRGQGMVLLIVATLCISSQGVAMRVFPSVRGTLVASWLLQCQSMALLPLAVFEYLSLPAARRRTILWDDILTSWYIPGAAFALSVRALGFFVAAEHTALIRAWVFCNMHAVFIAAFCLASRFRSRAASSSLSKPDIVCASGVALALAGILVTQVPVFFGRGVTPLVSDCFSLACSLGPFVFLELCRRVRAKMPLFLMMFPITLLSCVFFTAFVIVTGSGDLSISDTGVFGWLNSERVLFGMYLGIVVGFFGNVMCVAALDILPGVVVSVAQSMVPPVGTFMAVIEGAEHMPDTFTSIGVACMVLGVLYIASASAEETAMKKDEDPSDYV